MAQQTNSDGSIRDQVFEATVRGDVSAMVKNLAHIARTQGITTSQAIFSVRDNLGRNVLHLASYHGHEDIIRSIFESALSDDPANRNLVLFARSTSGDTAIAWAVRGGQAEVITSLFMQGLNSLDAHNILGSAPIHIATSLNNQDTLQTLLDLEADSAVTNAAGETALHLAARHDHVGCARRLLTHDGGAPINATDMFGMTALHRATERRHIAVLELLLSSGADKRVPDGSGRRPVVTALLAVLGGQSSNGVLGRLL